MLRIDPSSGAATPATNASGRLSHPAAAALQARIARCAPRPHLAASRLRLRRIFRCISHASPICISPASPLHPPPSLPLSKARVGAPLLVGPPSVRLRLPRGRKLFLGLAHLSISGAPARSFHLWYAFAARPPFELLALGRPFTLPSEMRLTQVRLEPPSPPAAPDLSPNPSP